MYQAHYSTTRNSRVVQTRLALNRAFLALLDEHGFEDISIPDLTSKAGVSYTTFYRHYASKEQLLDEIAKEEIHKLIDLTLPVFDHQARAPGQSASHVLAKYVSEHRHLWTTLLTGGAAPKLREEFMLIAHGIADDRGAGKNGLPADMAIVFGVGATLDLIACWLKQKKPISIKRFASVYERLVINSIHRD